MKNIKRTRKDAKDLVRTKKSAFKSWWRIESKQIKLTEEEKGTEEHQKVEMITEEKLNKPLSKLKNGKDPEKDEINAGNHKKLGWGNKRSMEIIKQHT